MTSYNCLWFQGWSFFPGSILRLKFEYTEIERQLQQWWIIMTVFKRNHPNSSIISIAVSCSFITGLQIFCRWSLFTWTKSSISAWFFFISSQTFFCIESSPSSLASRPLEIIFPMSSFSCKSLIRFKQNLFKWICKNKRNLIWNYIFWNLSLNF